MTTPSSVRSFGILTAEYNLPKVKVPKKKDAPIMTEARDKAVRESLHPEVRDEIAERAKAAAAAIMADFEMRRGRR